MGLFKSSPSSPATTPSDTMGNFQTRYPQCQGDMQRFLECMQSHDDDLNACQSFLEMMKNCQKMYA